jgi:hypothetical protein
VVNRPGVLRGGEWSTMRWEPTSKTPEERASANLSCYAWVRHDLTWSHAREWLSGLPGDGA